MRSPFSNPSPITGESCVDAIDGMAFAQGVPYEILGFERQRFKPDCLQGFEASGQATAEH